MYSEDASSYAFINSVVRTADVPKNEVARLFRSGTNLTLKLCTAAPIGDRLNKDCETVWSTTTDVVQTDADLVPRFLSVSAVHCLVCGGGRGNIERWRVGGQRLYRTGMQFIMSDPSVTHL